MSGNGSRLPITGCRSGGGWTTSPQFLREQRNGPWHLVDELIHHTAEVAILRDLWPGYPAITEG